MNRPVVVVLGGPDDPRAPLLPLADVVITACAAVAGEWFARLPGLTLLLVAGRTGYTIHHRGGTRQFSAGPIGDPSSAAGAAYAAWLADQDPAVSRSS
ncbi:hypothetical protein AB0H83_01430 [Dactylosporangium sp. NPDC050688]|uniref:hypothetical protein n=1 Tax=Dactylosporangium sp. NPDC050688 TaxID=3157217 RepID=UPI0033CEB004